MSVFASEELQNHLGGGDVVKKKEAEEDAAEGEEEMERWSQLYGSYSVMKPRQFLGSISDIVKKLPQGLQISRVSELNVTVNDNI